MEVMATLEHENLKQLEEYIRKYYPSLKYSDFTTMIDIIYMSALRNNIAIPVLLSDIYKGILDIDQFKTEKCGNIYNFINPKYRLFAERIKDITVGSNGGMANVGKGEWLISLCSGIDPQTDKPYVNIIKNGLGDYNIIGKNEEAKWNGGKVEIGMAGNEVTNKFNSSIDIPDKKWVPFRVKDKKIYTEEQINTFNAVYWKAISGEEISFLSDDELKQKIINMSFIKLFKKSDSFIMFNNDGKFHRFCNIEDVNTYYHDKLHLLKGTTCGFECRANQINSIALYCYVF
jgi:hypothetical protein